MNHVDVILAIPLAIGAIRGFTRGFLLEVASLIGLIAGVYVAAMFAGIAGNTLMQYVDWNPHAVKIVAFVIVFILVIIAVKLVARIIEKLFKIAGINFLNRIAGVVAGTLKIAFILSVVLIFFNYINRDRAFMSEETQTNSFLYNKVSALVPSLLPGSDFVSFRGVVDKVKFDSEEE